MPQIVVCTMYKFVTLNDYHRLKQPLLRLMRDQQIRGTILLAQEGMNGTLAGTRVAIDALLSFLHQDPRLAALSHQESFTKDMPFLRSRVKLKKEIVTMGIANIDPKHSAGTYVKPKDWNTLISDPDVLVVDTRNDYEIQVGAFKHAINPVTGSFRDLPHYVDKHLDPKKHKKIAMYCTGGIRCEKSTAYMKAQGFDEVYHLEGGILKYLKDIPEKDSLWQGECFVFDNRVTVNHQLKKGQYDQCHACRMPITDKDKNSDYYQHGISCPHCFNKTTSSQKARFTEREKQMRLAKERGEAHIGADSAVTISTRRTQKIQHYEKQRQLPHA